jgi:ribonuclease P protein component
VPRTLGRLTERKDFLRVAGGKRKWVAPGLILQVAPSDAPEAAGAGAEGRRIGFTASKKVGNAVARNRAKRRLRAAARALVADHGMAGHDYVMIARQETGAVRYGQLLAELEKALRRLKVWRDGPDAGAASAPARD